MIVIERPRVSGKTTMLLHYMVCNPYSIYVCYKEEYVKQTFIKAQQLGLNLDKSRFRSMSDPDVKVCHERGYKILVDDADVITKRQSLLGFNLIAIADIITVNKGDR